MKRALSLTLILFLCTGPLWAAVAPVGPSISAGGYWMAAAPQPVQFDTPPLPPDPVRLPSVHTTPVSMTTAAADEEEEYFSWDEIQAEMKKQAEAAAWSKDGFKIVPYGYLWGSTAWESSRTFIGDYTLWAISRDNEGEPAWHFVGKSTRLGIDVSGPRIPFFCCAKSGGKVEIDFQGAFAIENKPGVLLRHAYWEVKNDSFRLLMGQTWDVVAPLNPGTIMYSVYWGAGNIGYRRPQLRFEKYIPMSNTCLITLQTSANTDAASDFTTGLLAEGDHAGWPLVEGRAAVTLGYRGKNCNPWTFGVSGHIGEQIFDFASDDDKPIRTWSMNFDANMPIGHRMGIQGEFFMGEDLKTFLGGIVQGVDIPRQESIRSIGGWGEFWIYWAPRLHTHVGGGIDDPFDQDVTAVNGRTYNQAYWANLCFDVTPKFRLGVEASQWKTLFTDRRSGEATRLEFMARYAF